MKTAILAMAVMGAASMAAADNTISVISAEATGNGQYNVVSVDDGLYTLSRVTCLPMKAGVIDTAGDVGDLENDGQADMVDVVRGTDEHAIAKYACES